MDDHLTGLRKAMKNGVFKNFSFSKEHRKSVLETVRRTETKRHLHQWGDETLLMLLTTVQHHAKHGFDIIQALEQKGCIAFKGQEGSLYALLHYLENRGVLVTTWERETDKNHKYYALTSKGKKVLSRANKQEVNDTVSLKDLLEGEMA